MISRIAPRALTTEFDRGGRVRQIHCSSSKVCSKSFSLSMPSRMRVLTVTDLGTRINVDRKTAERYLCLLEQLFIVERLPAWSRSDLQRLVKAPKLHFVDSGLAAALRGTTANGISFDRTQFGPLLETSVLSELR